MFRLSLLRVSFLLSLGLCQLNTWAQLPAFRLIPAAGNQRLRVASADHQQNLYLATDLGLYSFDGSTLAGDLDTEALTAVYHDRHGAVWAGSKGGLIFHKPKGGSWHNFPVKSISPEAPITGFAEDTAGGLWMATYGEGLYYLSDDNFTPINRSDGLSSNDVYAIVAAPDGSVWVGTDQGISVCSMAKGQVSMHHYDKKNGLPDLIITAMTTGPTGNVWFGMHEGGVAYYDFKSQAFYCINNTLTLNSISALAVFRDNSLWIGTEDEGLFAYHVRHDSLQPVPLPITPGNNKISGLNIVDGHHLLVLTNSPAIILADLRVQYQSLPFAPVQALLVDRRQRVWMGAQRGLWCSTRGVIKPVTAASNLSVTALYEDPEGKLWVGTFGQGLFIFSPDGQRLQQWTELDGLSNNSILSINGHGNQIWLATLGGVTLYDNVKFTTFNDSEGLGANFVYTVYPDHQRNIWFGTDGKGLSLYRDGRFSNFRTMALPDGDSLSLHTILSVSDDKIGNLWFSTARDEIFAFNGVHLVPNQPVFSTAQSPVSWVRGHPNGAVLVGKESHLEVLKPHRQLIGLSHQTMLNAVDIDDAGTVWSGSNLGFFQFFPSGNEDAVHPKTMLNQVSVFLDSVNFSLKTTFDYDENNLVFGFKAVCYDNPSLISFRYRLIGHQSDWIYTADRKANFSKLPPGAFSFEVSAGYDNYFTDQNIVTYTFSIRRPYWVQPWFLLATTGLLLFILWKAWIFYANKINKAAADRKQELELKLSVLQSQINPHFLFNSFNTLISIIEEEPPALAVQYVEHLSDFFRNILHYKEVALIPLTEEIEVLKRYVFLLEKRFGASLNLDIGSLPPSAFIAPLTLQQLVENALKHNVLSKSRPLRIHIHADQQCILVENNLQLRLDKLPSTGFGLSSIKKRYLLLSEKPVGVYQDSDVFIVSIPIIVQPKQP
jgi:ligand-binding sensor domain-containing protein